MNGNLEFVVEDLYSVSFEDHGEVLVVRLGGRLDAATAPVIEKQVVTQIEEGRTQILLDFADVHYLSSAGMRLLLSAAKKLKAANGTFVLCSLSDMILDVIRMAGFDSILNIQADEGTGLQQF